MRRAGFTIVELLIVIVVIAILAAISVVAYNGIQTRASNNQTILAMKEFVKAYHSYALDNGDYPASSSCLGEGYPAPNNWCLSQSGAAECFGLGAATSTAHNTALRPYMGGKVASPSMQLPTCGATAYVGMYASYDTGNGTMRLYMMLKGDEACPPMSPNAASPTRVVSGDATLCRYVLSAV